MHVWHKKIPFFPYPNEEPSIHSLMGVRGVRNTVTVKPTVILTEIKAKIEEAFRRNAAFDAQRITVETHGRKVILSGQVRSWLEREEADAAAWAAPGVYEVENRISVMPEKGLDLDVRGDGE